MRSERWDRVPAACLPRQEVIRFPTGKHLPIMVNAVPLTSRHWHRGETQPPEGRQEDEPLALVIHQDVRLLKETEYLKDELVGIAAHELRTPLAVLKGTASTLLVQTARGRRAPLATWQEEMLHELEEATDRLTKLSEDLLDVARRVRDAVSTDRPETHRAGPGQSADQCHQVQPSGWPDSQYTVTQNISLKYEHIVPVSGFSR